MRVKKPLDKVVLEDFRIVCPFVMLNSLDTYIHLYKTTEQEALDVLNELKIKNGNFSGIFGEIKKETA